MAPNSFPTSAVPPIAIAPQNSTRSEPLTIPVGGVIRGWTEALQLMPVGSKWKLFIPSELGYGDGGAGQDIPGGATLIFEVELLSIGSKK